MSFVQGRLIKEDSTPRNKREIGTTLSWNWVDIQDVLSGEWDIGGSALRTDAIHDLLQTNKKTSEGI
jgi:hypothetical protein